MNFHFACDGAATRTWQAVRAQDPAAILRERELSLSTLNRTAGQPNSIDGKPEMRQRASGRSSLCMASLRLSLTLS